jgi:taurine dioxygenase
MSNSAIEVRPIAGALGAEISGIDLANDLNDGVFDFVQDALLKHNVIFFRDQKLTPHDQVAFAKRFGEIHRHPFVQGLDEAPDVIELIKLPHEKKNFGGVWHIDQAFSPNPVLGTILYAKETPPQGGDTLFANLYLAYEQLSEGMQRMLAGLRTYNVGDRGKKAGGVSRVERSKGENTMRMKEPDPDEPTEAVHPLIRTHPKTGRKALFISSHTIRFEDMTEEESAPLLHYLRQHIQKEEFTCRFRWQPGSLAMWDNRCTQHKAMNDYTGYRRVMNRVTVKGDAPF